MQDRILELVMQKDEITWQTILLDLVKTGEINAWDVDISLLTQRYLEIIRKIQEANLFVSGKVLLASAILLKIKSEKLIIEEIGSLDDLMFPREMEELDSFMDETGSRRIMLDTEPRLTIKTPQTRKRKVQIDDLIKALERALEVNDRRLFRIAERNRVPDHLFVPEKKKDIIEIINELYEQIKARFTKKPTLHFSELIPSFSKEDKIAVFIPLLHLAQQAKLDLDQKEHFGEIEIKLFQY